MPQLPAIRVTDTAVEIQRQFRADWFGVEINQFQQLLAEDFIQSCQNLGVQMPLMGIHNDVNKIVRIRRLIPYFSQTQIRFKGGSPGAKLLVEQLRDFPNGDHDDGPDALELAIRLATELLHQAYYSEPEIQAKVNGRTTLLLMCNRIRAKADFR